VQPLTPEQCLPAAGQGAIAVEVRADDDTTRVLVEAVSHASTKLCVEAERTFLHRIEAGCQAAATAHARLGDGKLRLDALVADANGRAVLMEREVAEPPEGRFAAARLAERLLVAGAEEILRRDRPRRQGGDGPA
jgi:hydroxymethylbilane synthase